MKKPMVTVEMSLEAHKAFKLACVAAGTTMSAVMREAAEGFVAFARAAKAAEERRREEG